jgi:hypothetical protein
MTFYLPVSSGLKLHSFPGLARVQILAGKNQMLFTSMVRMRVMSC